MHVLSFDDQEFQVPDVLAAGANFFRPLMQEELLDSGDELFQLTHPSCTASNLGRLVKVLDGVGLSWWTRVQVEGVFEAALFLDVSKACLLQIVRAWLSKSKGAIIPQHVLQAMFALGRDLLLDTSSASERDAILDRMIACLEPNDKWVISCLAEFVVVDPSQVSCSSISRAVDSFKQIVSLVGPQDYGTAAGLAKWLPFKLHIEGDDVRSLALNALRRICGLEGGKGHSIGYGSSVGSFGIDDKGCQAVAAALEAEGEDKLAVGLLYDAAAAVQHPVYTPFLLKKLRHSSSDVQVAAVRTLSQKHSVADVDVTDALQSLLQDANEGVRFAAEVGLHHLGQSGKAEFVQNVMRFLEVDGEGQQAAQEFLQNLHLDGDSSYDAEIIAFWMNMARAGNTATAHNKIYECPYRGHWPRGCSIPGSIISRRGAPSMKDMVETSLSWVQFDSGAAQSTERVLEAVLLAHNMEVLLDSAGTDWVEDVLRRCLAHSFDRAAMNVGKALAQKASSDRRSLLEALLQTACDGGPSDFLSLDAIVQFVEKHGLREWCILPKLFSSSQIKSMLCWRFGNYEWMRSSILASLTGVDAEEKHGALCVLLTTEDHWEDLSHCLVHGVLEHLLLHEDCHLSNPSLVLQWLANVIRSWHDPNSVPPELGVLLKPRQEYHSLPWIMVQERRRQLKDMLQGQAAKVDSICAPPGAIRQASRRLACLLR